MQKILGSTRIGIRAFAVTLCSYGWVILIEKIKTLFGLSPFNVLELSFLEVILNSFSMIVVGVFFLGLSRGKEKDVTEDNQEKSTLP